MIPRPRVHWAASGNLRKRFTHLYKTEYSLGPSITISHLVGFYTSALLRLATMGTPFLFIQQCNSVRRYVADCIALEMKISTDPPSLVPGRTERPLYPFTDAVKLRFARGNDAQLFWLHLVANQFPRYAILSPSAISRVRAHNLDPKDSVLEAMHLRILTSCTAGQPWLLQRRGYSVP
jgi:hypothetical protein